MTELTSTEFNLKVPWGHIAAKAWGHKDDTHVLVVHGLLDNASSFDRLIAQLPRNFYYVCIDLPGHGLSSHFQSGTVLSYYSYILTIKYVLDELNWQQTYYIGHSLGAHLAMFFTSIYPDRIKKLILIDGVIPKPIPDDVLIERIREELQIAIDSTKLKEPRYYTKEEVLYALQNLRKCSLTTEAANAVFDRFATKVGDDLYYYNRDYRAKISISPKLSLSTSLKLVKKIKVETLIIFVDNTLPFIKHMKDQLYNILKDFNYVHIVEVHGNHDIHNNYPERISGHISKFLCHTPSKL